MYVGYALRLVTEFAIPLPLPAYADFEYDCQCLGNGFSGDWSAVCGSLCVERVCMYLWTGDLQSPMSGRHP